MTILRIIPCNACGTEGGIRHFTHISREDGQWDGYIEPCPYCGGTGGEIIETQPVEMDDLDAMCGSANSAGNEAVRQLGRQLGNSAGNEAIRQAGSDDLEAELDRLLYAPPESGEQWAHICAIEAELNRRAESVGQRRIDRQATKQLGNSAGNEAVRQ